MDITVWRRYCLGILFILHFFLFFSEIGSFFSELGAIGTGAKGTGGVVSSFAFASSVGMPHILLTASYNWMARMNLFNHRSTSIFYTWFHKIFNRETMFALSFFRAWIWRTRDFKALYIHKLYAPVFFVFFFLF